MDAPPDSAADLDRELAELRRRAFAPDADIHLHPEAVERLHALEIRRRAALWQPASAVGAGASEARPGVRREPAQHLEPEGADALVALFDAQGTAAPAPVAPQPAPASPVRRGRRGGAWRAVGLVAVGLVVGVIAGMAIPHGASGDATLRPKAQQESKGFWSSDLGWLGVQSGTVREFDSYRALDVWSMQKTTGEDCIVLTHEDQFVGNGCAAHGLDPVVDMVVADDGFPMAQIIGLPAGSLIRFILTGDVVEVHELAAPSAPSAPPPSPQGGMLDLQPGG